MPDRTHIGRFAPSPTGPLHQGSLVAALGSYLCARRQRGKWQVRIEDLDPPREQAGAADEILKALEAHGLEWDGSVLKQSERHDIYQQTVDTLGDQELAYFCQCSRREWQEQANAETYGSVYPGTCRLKSLRKGAVRLRVSGARLCFNDLLLGPYCQNLEQEVGDFVIQRRDGLFAYQLAVVIDDALQGITDIVRGADLLDNTPRQIFLQQTLGFPPSRYLHLPLVRNRDGQKLSKQNLAPPLNLRSSGKNLQNALVFLGFKVPASVTGAGAKDLLEWCLIEANWQDTTLAAYAD